MAEVFISHAATDLPLAEVLHRHLTQEGLSVYLASVSMPPCKRWMPHIMDNLHGLTWLLCLASRAVCASTWMMQEIGAAVIPLAKDGEIIQSTCMSQHEPGLALPCAGRTARHRHHVDISSVLIALFL